MTDNIRAYAEEFREVVLQGASSERMCIALSAPLHAALQVLGVPSRLMETSFGEFSHVFISLDDGRVLDPTADQFNGCSNEKLPGVYLGVPAGIHGGATPWPDGQEWQALMEQLKRLYPAFHAREVGKTVGLVLRSLPAGLCDFIPAASRPELAHIGGNMAHADTEDLERLRAAGLAG